MTRSDAHHRLLFDSAGLEVVEMQQESETCFWALRRKRSLAAVAVAPAADTITSSHYACAGCGAPLFSTSTKFAFSDCQGPQPSFSSCYAGRLRVEVLMANGLLMTRCVKCDAPIGTLHLGESFTSTKERHRANKMAILIVDRAPQGEEDGNGLLKEEGARAMRDALVSLG